jgi:hypothetical protein
MSAGLLTGFHSWRYAVTRWQKAGWFEKESLSTLGRLRTANLGFSNINDGFKTGEKVHSQQTIYKSGYRQIGGEDGEIAHMMTQTAEPRDSDHRRCNSATPCEGCEPAQRILQVATQSL